MEEYLISLGGTPIRDMIMATMMLGFLRCLGSLMSGVIVTLDSSKYALQQVFTKSKVLPKTRVLPQQWPPSCKSLLKPPQNAAMVEGQGYGFFSGLNSLGVDLTTFQNVFRATEKTVHWTILTCLIAVAQFEEISPTPNQKTHTKKNTFHLQVGVEDVL